MTEKMPLSQEWLDFCKRGRLPQGRQRKSVECSVVAGKVRGYYSDLVLDPTLDWTDSLYPSHDHTTHPRDHSNMVVEARVVNDMKGHLNDDEFWRMIEHLYAVGVSKRKIRSGLARRLSPHWRPERNYCKSAPPGKDGTPNKRRKPE
jgi:hypothetical protein